MEFYATIIVNVRAYSLIFSMLWFVLVFIEAGPLLRVVFEVNYAS